VPLLLVDGLEALDAEHFDAMVAELKRHDVQALVTRVTEGPLAVSVP
jgi:hypothetical protein